MVPSFTTVISGYPYTDSLPQDGRCVLSLETCSMGLVYRFAHSSSVECLDLNFSEELPFPFTRTYTVYIVLFFCM